MAIGILLIRLVVGLTFAVHGTQKLFGWFGGYGLAGTAQFFSMLGFRGRLQALLAGLAETGGGILLVLGLLTPLGSLALISVMFVAVATVHIKKGFMNTNGGYEYPLVLAVTALAIAFTGPGPWSVDARLGLNDAGWLCGVLALVLGVLAGFVALLQRKAPPPAALPGATT